MIDPVRLTVVPNEGEAAILCGLLETEGIACAHRRTDVGVGAADASATFGGWREVLVERSQLEIATELLAGTDDAPE
ncbi:MAG: hypothetical protein U0R50_04045 [Gaiellales bacterium]